VSPEEAFAQLLGRQPTDAEKARLTRVRTTLQLRDNDALWQVLLTLEAYDCSFRTYPALLEAQLQRAVQTMVPCARCRTGAPLSSSLARSALLILFGAVCAVAGGTTPKSPSSTLLALLNVPAGWMIFALAAAAACGVALESARRGRSAKTAGERWSARALFTGSLLAAGSCLILLLRFLT
jgi:hypothetical protein